MEAEAVTRIGRLAVEAEVPKTVTIAGVEYAREKLVEVRPSKPELANTVAVSTLTAFVDFLHHHAPHAEGSFVHVESETRVRLVGPLDARKQRESLVVAQHEPPTIRDLTENWMAVEDFLIGVQSRFTSAGDRDRLFGLVGNISNDEKAQQSDDGITQRVLVKRGVTSLGEEQITNPFRLSPFATFPELTQPEQPFVLRVRNSNHGIAARLFPADGGAWRLTAVADVKRWLEEYLEQTNAALLPILA